MLILKFQCQGLILESIKNEDVHFILFIVVKKKKVPGSKVSEWLNILQYSYKSECYVVHKMNSVKVLIDYIVGKNVSSKIV